MYADSHTLTMACLYRISKDTLDYVEQSDLVENWRKSIPDRPRQGQIGDEGEETDSDTRSDEERSSAVSILTLFQIAT